MAICVKREFTVVRDNGHRRRDAEDGRNGRGQQHLAVYAVCDAADDGTAEGERQSPQHGTNETRNGEPVISNV